MTPTSYHVWHYELGAFPVEAQDLVQGHCLTCCLDAHMKILLHRIWEVVREQLHGDPDGRILGSAQEKPSYDQVGFRLNLPYSAFQSPTIPSPRNPKALLVLRPDFDNARSGMLLRRAKERSKRARGTTVGG